MVRAEVLPVPLESYDSGVAAVPRSSISVTIAVDGNIYVGRSIVLPQDVGQAVIRKLEDNPDAVIYLIVEDGEAIVDRGPLLTGTWDQLRKNGLEIFLVGTPDVEDLDDSP